MSQLHALQFHLNHCYRRRRFGLGWAVVAGTVVSRCGVVPRVTRPTRSAGLVVEDATLPPRKLLVTGAAASAAHLRPCSPTSTSAGARQAHYAGRARTCPTAWSSSSADRDPLCARGDEGCTRGQLRRRVERRPLSTTRTLPRTPVIVTGPCSTPPWLGVSRTCSLDRRGLRLDRVGLFTEPRARSLLALLGDHGRRDLLVSPPSTRRDKASIVRGSNNYGPRSTRRKRIP